MAAADRRPVFAVPRAQVTYLGTTDSFHSGAEYWPEVTTQEVDYLLETSKRSFRGRALQPEDVIACWSGVRPLVAQSGKKPSEISRRDEVWQGPGGVWSIAGGKLTSYRAMAERVVDRVAGVLGHREARGDTHERPLAGGDFELEASPAESAGQPDRGQARLRDLYGAEAGEVAEQGGDVAAEVRQAVCREGALRLEDYWQRRSGRSCFDLDAGLACLEPASRVMSSLLGWSEDFRAQEVERCSALHLRQNRFFEAARSAASAGGGAA